MPQGFHHRIRLFISFLILQGTCSYVAVSGQSGIDVRLVKEHFDRSYGPDYNLVNGRQYKLNYSITSHPFFNAELPRLGRVVVNGMIYDALPINYDLYQQVLIAQHISPVIGTNYLVLNIEFVDEFMLDGKLFRKVILPGEKTRYAQVIESDSQRFVIFWKKNMNFSGSMNETPYRYSEQMRRIFLEDGHLLAAAGSKSAFLTRYNDSQRPLIRQYMRDRHIRIRTASDAQLMGLLEYCGQLSEGGL